MSLTKQDIDALVDGMRRVGDNGFYRAIGGQWLSPWDLREEMYLAAGLSAEGERKPDRVRCYMVVNPEYSAYRHFWEHVYEGQFPSRYQVIPGWFVPDGVE